MPTEVLSLETGRVEASGGAAGRRKLTVLYVDNSIDWGGAPKSLSLLLGGMPGVRQRIVSSQKREFLETFFPAARHHRFRRFFNYQTRSRLERRLGGAGRLGALALKAYGLADLAAGALASVHIAALAWWYRADIIHANNGLFQTEVLRAARLSRKPCVVHVRSYVGRPAAWELRAATLASCVVGVSGGAVSELRAALPTLDSVTIHDPVDLAAITRGLAHREEVRRELGLEPAHVAFGIFGRIVEWKGQHVFASAMVGAMAEAPQLRAIFVGSPSDASGKYMAGLRDYVAASGFGDRFIFTGYRTDVESLYGAVDVTVHASIEPEPFGMVIPESMAAGRPVIAADAGGPRETVTEGVDGLRTPPGDVAALRAAILRLARDPDLRARLGANGIDTARRKFTIEAHAAAVRQVYDRVLRQPRRAGP